MDAPAAGRLWEELGMGRLRQRARESSWTAGEGTALALCLRLSHTRDARGWDTGTGGWQARVRIRTPAAPTLWVCRKALHKVHFPRGKQELKIAHASPGLQA